MEAKYVIQSFISFKMLLIAEDQLRETKMPIVVFFCIEKLCFHIFIWFICRERFNSYDVERR